MFKLPSERTRQIYVRLESWERLRAQRTRENFSVASSDPSPSVELQPNSTQDSPEPYRLSNVGVGDITNQEVLTMLECCEMQSGSGG